MLFFHFINNHFPQQKPGPSDFSTTYIFGNEEHTLGNSLRHVLMQQSETDFCGYTVPHPYEPKMNVRLQTYRGTAPTIKVLRAGLTDMEKMCDLIGDKFERALQEFDGTAAPAAASSSSQQPSTKKSKGSKK